MRLHQLHEGSGPFNPISIFCFPPPSYRKNKVVSCLVRSYEAFVVQQTQVDKTKNMACKEEKVHSNRDWIVIGIKSSVTKGHVFAVVEISGAKLKKDI